MQKKGAWTGISVQAAQPPDPKAHYMLGKINFRVTTRTRSQRLFELQVRRQWLPSEMKLTIVYTFSLTTWASIRLMVEPLVL